MPYPFAKHDHVFTPEHSFDAMENVGCVTYHERLLETSSISDKITLESHILHEIAHQWFGNLVTPQWWDELWLNESFATFLSFLALEKCSSD
jgi:aminopeptidase N